MTCLQFPHEGKVPMKPAKKGYCLLALIGALLSFPGTPTAEGQTEFSGQHVGPEGPQFFLETLSFASTVPGKSRLDVYVDVGYDVLQFVNEAGTYRATYEGTVPIP